jgi:hypothetical protein
MSYRTVNISVLDQALYGRVQAAVVEQQLAAEVPVDLGATTNIMWMVCSANDVESAYASALAGLNPDPGGDESVITDGMILANVQANMP